MKKSLKVSIPKPCHENWSKMKPNEKGRFCNSCAKTVIDFTQKSAPEIQEFLLRNRHKKVCGHFYKKQLDSITIEIPEHILYQQLSFSKLFLLTLLITMGTTLLSCNLNNGKKQKIENVVLVDSIKKNEKEINSTKNASDNLSKIDSTKTSYAPPFCPPPKFNDSIPDIVTIEGGITVGDVDITESEEIIFGLITENPPQFLGTKDGSVGALKKSFSDSISKFVSARFNLEKTKGLGLKRGKHKIWTQFTIDEHGNVINIRARAPRKELENQAVEILKKLPKFIPGQQRGIPAKVIYTFPIVFETE